MTDKRNAPIRSLRKTALRTYIFDPDEWESKYAIEIEKDENHPGYSVLIWSSLQTAILRHFSPTCSLADVIRYVADLRIFLADHASMVNPRLAEKIIRSLLGDDSLQELPPFGETPEDMQSTALLLLASLVAKADLDESGVDELIDEAADKADQFDWSSIFARESIGPPHLDTERDEDAGGDEERGVAQEPSRDAGGGWESS